jgi:hypothetical protein
MQENVNEQDSDQLGTLLGRYSTRIYALKWLAGGSVLWVLGALSCMKAGGILQRLADVAFEQQIWLIVGWILLGCSVLPLLAGLRLTRQVLEIRRKGVRYRSWLGTRAMCWGEIDDFHVNKVTVIKRSGARTSRFTVRISSEDSCIVLRPWFLAGLSVLAVIQMLKLHGGRSVWLGDCDVIDVANEVRESFPCEVRGADVAVPGKRKGRPRKRRDEKPAAGPLAYDEACAQLDGGTPVPQVEAWLRLQGIPAAAAAAMIDKALGERVHREAEAAESDDGPIQEARKQLAAGVKPEKVERWLRDQGLGKHRAAAIMENLRQELL